MKKHLVIDMSFFTVSFSRFAPSRDEHRNRKSQNRCDFGALSCSDPEDLAQDANEHVHDSDSSENDEDVHEHYAHDLSSTRFVRASHKGQGGPGTEPEPETGTVRTVFAGTESGTGTAGTVFQEPRPEPEPSSL